jgi:hypothetical protein
MTGRKPSLKIGIVGGSPWGMAVLDRLISHARKDARQHFEVSLFDPGPFGPGVHDPNQAAHLLLNTITAQVDSFSAEHFDEHSLPGAMTFLDWSRQTQDPETTANGLLSCSQFGRHMLYVYATLKANLPSNLLLAESRTAITGITRSGQATKCLSSAVSCLTGPRGGTS